MKFYGLRDLPEPLVAEYNIKGKLTQLNLVNSALLQLLQSHLNCKGSPLFLGGSFKLFQDGSSNVRKACPAAQIGAM